MSPRLIFISLAMPRLFSGRSANHWARTGHDPGEVDDQRHEQDDADDEDAGDGLVHAASYPRSARRRRSRSRALAHHVGAVRDHEQQRDEHEVGGDGAAAVAHERQRDAGERDEPRDAAEDDERLQAEGARRARRRAAWRSRPAPTRRCGSRAT